LLGISMRLALMGGVDLAQGNTTSADREGCLECQGRVAELAGAPKFRLLGDESRRAGLTIEGAEVCEAEFVPEPGTIALLGSGLAGLAGYAALRRRSK